MANEIYTTWPEGETLYATVRRVSDGYVWNTNTTAFEVWSDGNLGDYAISLSDKDGNHYSADFPSDIDEGYYKCDFFIQAGGSPADGDWSFVSGSLSWDGDSELLISDVIRDLRRVNNVYEVSPVDTRPRIEYL